MMGRPTKQLHKKRSSLSLIRIYIEISAFFITHMYILKLNFFVEVCIHIPPSPSLYTINSRTLLGNERAQALTGMAALPPARAKRQNLA